MKNLKLFIKKHMTSLTATSPRLIPLVVMGMCYASGLWADDVSDALNEGLDWMVYTIGPVVAGYGIIKGLYSWSTGNREGLQQAQNGILGGIGIFLVTGIIDLIMIWTN